VKVLSSVTSLKSPALWTDLIWVRTGGLGRTIPADMTTVASAASGPSARPRGC
jgi:hypothetical protein